MPEVHIDISLFTKDAAFGMISGTLQLPVVPQVGDALSFRIAGSVKAVCGKLPSVECFESPIGS